MIRLNEKQIGDKISFINNYINAENAATASTMDANANVDSKNIATMEAELWKAKFYRNMFYDELRQLDKSDFLSDEELDRLLKSKRN